MKKILIFMAVFVSCLPLLQGAPLTVTQDSITIEGGTYDMIDLSGRKYVTLRNVTVRNTTGENYYAAVHLNGSKYITMENCEVDGGAQAVRGNGSCGGIKVNGSSRITIKDCKIHNLNDDGIRMYMATIVDIIGNDIYNLRSCGTDPNPDCANCVNGHSDGIQIIDCIRVNVIGNMIHSEYNGTSALFMGNEGTNCKDVTIANNIMNTPQCYYTVYMHFQERFKLYNNVIWGYRPGGASIWYSKNLWDLEIVNNIVKYVKFKYGGGYNPSEHTIMNNCFATAFNYGSGNLQGQDPGFVGVSASATPTNINPDIFTLKSSSACIDQGLKNSSTPDTDYFGLGRSGAPDIGAFEYNGTDMRFPLWNSPDATVEVEVYPRPLHRRLCLESADFMLSNISLTLHDHTGRVVRSHRGTGDRRAYEWDVEDLAPGTYWYRAVINGQEILGKVVKIK